MWHSTLLRFQLREMLLEAKTSSFSSTCRDALNLLDISVDATGELNINITKAKEAIEREWKIFSKLLGHITVLAGACLHESKMAPVCQKKGWNQVISYEGKADFDKAATERRTTRRSRRRRRKRRPTTLLRNRTRDPVRRRVRNGVARADRDLVKIVPPLAQVPRLPPMGKTREAAEIAVPAVTSSRRRGIAPFARTGAIGTESAP